MSNIYKNIVAVSKAVNNDFLKNLKIKIKKMVIINNPFDIKIILQESKKPCFFSQTNYLLHVGRLHIHKCYDRLIQEHAMHYRKFIFL